MVALHRVEYHAHALPCLSKPPKTKTRRGAMQCATDGECWNGHNSYSTLSSHKYTGPTRSPFPTSMAKDVGRVVLLLLPQCCPLLPILWIPQHHAPHAHVTERALLVMLLHFGHVGGIAGRVQILETEWKKNTTCGEGAVIGRRQCPTGVGSRRSGRSGETLGTRHLCFVAVCGQWVFF